MKGNLRRHEVIGLIMVFLSWTCFGYGLYIIMWAVQKAAMYNSAEYLLKGTDLLLIPLFFGSAALLWCLGRIELREAQPGGGRGA
jgi:hypothetical protein